MRPARFFLEDRGCGRCKRSPRLEQLGLGLPKIEDFRFLFGDTRHPAHRSDDKYIYI